MQHIEKKESFVEKKNTILQALFIQHEFIFLIISRQVKMNQLNEEIAAVIAKNINESIATHFEKMTQRVMAMVNQKMEKDRLIATQNQNQQKRKEKQAKVRLKLKYSLKERIKALQGLYLKLQKSNSKKIFIKRQKIQINTNSQQSEDKSIMQEALFQRFAQDKRPSMHKMYPSASGQKINRALLKKWKLMSSQIKELYRLKVQKQMKENQSDCGSIREERKGEEQLQEANEDKLSQHSDQASKIMRLNGEMENFTIEDQQYFPTQDSNQCKLQDCDSIIVKMPKKVENEGLVESIISIKQVQPMKDGKHIQ